MEFEKSERGFICVTHLKYGSTEQERILQESSIIGDYSNSMKNPGSSYLWVGEYHHLDREGVAELINILEYWLENKRLPQSGEEI